MNEKMNNGKAFINISSLIENFMSKAAFCIGELFRGDYLSFARNECVYIIMRVFEVLKRLCLMPRLYR